MYGSNNNGGYGNNSGNFGYGYGQQKPEPPKETPEWVTWVVIGAIVLFLFTVMMPADEKKALADFIGWGGKIVVLGALLIGGLIWWASTSTTEGDAKARGGLAVTAFGFLLLILVIVGVLRGVGFIGDNDERGQREKPPFGIPFKMK